MRVVIYALFCALGLLAKNIYGKTTVINLGPYRFTERSDPGQSPQLEITRRSAPHKEHSSIWSTVKDYPFLRLGDATMSRPPILNGNYQLDETTKYLSDTVTVETIFEEETDQKVVIYGQLLAADMELIAHYTLTFQVTNLESQQIQFNVDIRPTDDCTTSIQNARSFLTYATEQDENFYGFGESFSFFNLKGRRVPILVSEQGVGRGEQPITDYLNANVAQGVGGDWYTTYAPKPIYITNHNRTVFLNNSEVSFFDLTATGGDAGTQAVPRVQVEVWSLSLLGYLMQSPSMLRAVEAVTELTGRQKVLPAWSQEGAVVGLEGGTENVTRIVNSMYEAGVPMAGIWLQDWVGLQHSWDGDRLIWNWELNKDHYPGWDEMVSLWASRGTRVLTYMSPFFSDPSAYSNSTTAFRHNFFQEGLEKGYFVQNSNHTTYLMYSLSIKFAMLDLTNPAAVAWMQEIIINQSVEEGHSSGWMCDFGEYLPFDAVLHSGESAASFHNRFPEEWGALTFRALEEAGRRRQAKIEAEGGGDVQSEVSSTTTATEISGVSSLPPVDPADVVYFMRSAWIQSPRYAAVFWLGDQLVSWDSNDGLRSALTGALSSGLVGHAITHSDIGGYTVELGMPANMTYIRTPELLKRWSEFSAFGFGLYRTHIGSSTSPVDAQVYDSPESMAHFGRFAGVFAQLKEYRMELMQEAAQTGHPLVRPLCLHYGFDPAVWSLTEQYLVGTQFLAAPVLHEGAVSVEVYFPKHSGTWVHIWSGNEITAPADGLTLTVPAPIGFPPVFFKKGSVHGEQLRTYLMRMGYVQGYEWDCAACGGSSVGSVDTSGGAKVGETVTTNSSPALPLSIIILLLAFGMGVYYAYVRRSSKGQDVVSGGTVYERLAPTDEL